MNQYLSQALMRDYIVKWKNYYYRALKESFHIEEHFNYQYQI
jgi:hypothetical protein